MSLDYTVRESLKAKHVSLKMSITGDLEVIVPKGFDQKQIPDILRRKQRWIDRVTERMTTQQTLAGADVATERPDQISLQAIAETWRITYQPTAKSTLHIQEAPKQQLILKGNTQDLDYCKHALQQWMVGKAHHHLAPWLQQVSRDTKLAFQNISIRRQKTVWGSCSEGKNISLNAKLLFLPSDMVRYVLVHELCHTIHLNHSRDFWALVSQHEPNYRQLDTGLRDARYLVPWWMER